MKKFPTLILGAPLLESLPPEIIEQILTITMRGPSYNWDSHVLQTYNSLRNLCRFWRMFKSMFSRVHILYEEALPSKLKGAKITVNVQQLIEKVDSSSGYIKTSDQPHSSPLTPTHPKYTSTHPHLPIKNVHPPPATQNIPPPTPTHL